MVWHAFPKLSLIFFLIIIENDMLSGNVISFSMLISKHTWTLTIENDPNDKI